jgi:Icc-related predicted phosphoesterase
MTRITCIADLHEHLVEIPACDLLLIAGDVSFAFKGNLRAKQTFLAGPFADWLNRVPAEEIVLVAGNHDQSIEQWGIPDGLRSHYLQDEGIELFGLKIWGSPWQPWFHDWAFNAPRRHGEVFLASKFEPIPAGTDIIVGHGPPLGYGDLTARPGGNAHVGSSAMTATLRRVRPRLMVCGHIHRAYGRYRLDETEVINASLVDNEYRPVNAVMMFELDSSQ